MNFQIPPAVTSRAMPVSMVDPYFSPSPGMEGFSRHGTLSSSSQASYYGGSPAPALSPVIYQHSGNHHGFSNSRNYADIDAAAAAANNNRFDPQGNPMYYHSHSTYYTQPSSSSKHRRYFRASAPQPQPQTQQHPPIGQPPRHVSVHSEWDGGAAGAAARIPRDEYMHDVESPRSYDSREYMVETSRSPRHGGSGSADKSSKGGRSPSVKYYSQRRPSNRDEFDGPHQLLKPPSPQTIQAQERELPVLPTNLDVAEQDRILSQVNDCLSQCAFNFVAKYQFPIPIEPDKRQVRVPGDREWTEWVYLLKRLATKRRIPARVLHDGQIKQLVTVLENSLEMRHAAKHQSRPVKDDRNVLQLISAGTQVAKILKDATAMDYLNHLYLKTEDNIKERQARRVKFTS